LRLLLACFAASLLFSPPAGADSIVELPVPANDLVYHAPSGLIYASIPGASPAYPNTIARIDPTSGQVVGAVSIGSEPTALALTDDDQFLYVGLAGAASVRRYDTRTNTASIQWSMGEEDGRQLYPLRLAALPGQPHAVAVTRRTETFSASLAVYDDGVQRPVISHFGYLSQSGITSSLSPFRLYGIDYQSLTPLSVTSQGVLALPGVVMPLGNGYSNTAVFQRGLIFAASGRVLDPEGGELLGTFPGLIGSETQICPDLPHGVVFYLSRDNYGVPCTLRAYDVRTFTLIGEMAFPNAGGPLSSLIRWGSDGLAFATGSKLHLIRTNWISQSAPTVDLKLSASSLPAQIPAGETLTYTLTVKNTGTDTATNVTVADTFPNYATVGATNPSQGTVVRVGEVVTARLGDLAPNATATVSIQVRFAITGAASHSARVVAFEEDSNPEDDQLTGAVTVSTPLIAELDAQWEGVTVTCPPRGKCQYKGKLTVRNRGGQDAKKFAVRIYVSDRADVQSIAAKLVEVKIARLRAGKSMVIRLNKKNYLGNYRYAFAAVDPLEVVPEANENDNMTVTELSIR